jgi:hypothetical protein
MSASSALLVRFPPSLLFGPCHVIIVTSWAGFEPAPQNNPYPFPHPFPSTFTLLVLPSAEVRVPRHTSSVPSAYPPSPTDPVNTNSSRIVSAQPVESRPFSSILALTSLVSFRLIHLVLLSFQPASRSPLESHIPNLIHGNFILSGYATRHDPNRISLHSPPKHDLR